MDIRTLEATAKALVPPGKGILAADESMGTISKRFGALGIECTEENRRIYRQMLFTSAGLAECISGVILFDETIRQKTDDGTPFPEYLESQGAIPGIKVDKGKIPLPAAPGEDVTEGLDGLADRLAEYRDLGARFAKWRSVIHIGPGLPTTYAIDANAHGLARYAALCQDAGIVPIVEPEVLMDGDHDIERCLYVTERTLRATYRQMAMQRLHMEGTLLKPNMVLSGKGCPTQAGPKEVAEMTLRCLRRAVPASVPGIVFLSGGQTDDQATENLDAINRAEGPKPWQLSFSYGRALQAAAMTAWGGKPTHIEEGKKVFQERALANAAARDGRFSPAA